MAHGLPIAASDGMLKRFKGIGSIPSLAAWSAYLGIGRLGIGHRRAMWASVQVAAGHRASVPCAMWDAETASARHEGHRFHLPAGSSWACAHGASMPYAAADDAETADAQIGRPCAMWRVGADALCRLNAADDAETRHVGCPDGIGHPAFRRHRRRCSSA